MPLASLLAGPAPASSFLEPVLLHFVEEVGLGAAEVDDLGTAVPILLLDRALLAVVGVGDTRPSADNTPTLEKGNVTPWLLEG